ncbi:MAG TPA: DinB family protein [Anaerolineales bacterium]|nr:DinB family protein [Anaerolineales bacterium]
MRSGHAETLRWQFRLTWQLTEYYLPSLTDEACLWEPAQGSWNVRRAADGTWRPDWAEPEPDPVPTVTIGWLTWHIIWWWSGLLASMREERPTSREAVFWPGSAEAVRQQLGALSAGWTDVLSGLEDNDLSRPFTYPWREQRPLSYAVAWCNSELMKNIAEIGYVLHLFESSRRYP